jgi:arylsulfatase A-like enzyme
MKAYYREGYGLLIQLSLLTFMFLLVETSFFIQGLHFYFGDFNFIAHKIDIPAAIIPGILFFVLAQLLVHFAAACWIWISSLSLAFVLKLSLKDCEKLGLFFWILGLLTICLSNQYYFPNSKFAALSRFLVPDTLALVLLVSLYCFWAVVFLLTAYVSFSHLKMSLKLLVIVLSFSIGSYWGYQSFFYRVKDAGTEEKPNIILIGVDSLRPDFLDFFGSPLKTQFFNAFLQQATVFSNAFTPLARTFPSWIGILSGVYPKESGIRFNLAAHYPNSETPLLSSILREHGYKTIFATDETRFSNIDKPFGFDKVVTPPMGLNDFLLGSFNDFPLSNLMVNTLMGRWLFPHNFANRPMEITYEPDSFLSLLKPHLKQNRTQPLFLAVHLCLPHYPYLWAAYPGFQNMKNSARYKASVLRVDQQLMQLMAMLEQNRLLDHAIVVLLSDHGEALELRGDRITSPRTFLSSKKAPSTKIPRFYPPSADKEAVDQSGGHGTDVLGFPQYHSLLAFHLYGVKTQAQAVKKISEPVLLLDIKPTILDFLKIANKSSGLSLKSVILGKTTQVSALTRPIFLESDFSPEAIRSAHPETRNLIFEGIELFRIDPHTTRIFVKDSMGQLILSSKQYALIEGDWVLALYPRAKGKMIPVLVQLSTGKWTTDMSISFVQKSPIKRMMSTLKQFYGSELKQL